MRIVITEFMDPRAVAQLEARHEVLYAPDLVDNPAQLLTEARTADAIIVRNRTQVRGDLLDQLTQCRCVGRLGVGLDNIDVEGCVDRNILPRDRRELLERCRIRDLGNDDASSACLQRDHADDPGKMATCRVE